MSKQCQQGSQPPKFCKCNMGVRESDGFSAVCVLAGSPSGVVKRGDMKILIGCNKSGKEAMAFQELGHDAWTCDILPAEYEGNHIQDDVLKHLNDGWAMGIFNPDCTYLANSGVRWLFERPERWELMIKACDFFNKLLNAPIPRICVENPIQHKYARQYIRKPDQIIQPYHFGDMESKATCLWLIGLPPLMSRYSGGEGIKQSVFREPPSPERKTNRARSFQGIANAMAEQWGWTPYSKEKPQK